MAVVHEIGILSPHISCLSSRSPLSSWPGVKAGSRVEEIEQEAPIDSPVERKTHTAMEQPWNSQCVSGGGTKTLRLEECSV